MTHIRLVATAVLITSLALTHTAAAAQVLNLTPPDTGFVASNLSDDAARDSQSAGGTSYSPAELDNQPKLQTRHFGARATLSCKVAGTPHDLVVANDGAEPLPSGTRIKWQLKSAGLFGYFALLNELPGGASLVADDVVAGPAETGTTCVARVI